MREISIRGERFILHPERVLIWPSRRLLIAADLHLGKAERFLYGGMEDSPQDQWQGLLKIEKLASQFSIQHIMFLGDFLHSQHGLTEGIVQDFSDFLLRIDQDVTLVPSNRDRSALKLLGEHFPKMEVLYQWQIDEFIFQHQPPRVLSENESFYWCGHLNPSSGGSPCFVLDGHVGLLPAFSPVLRESNDVEDIPGRRIFICEQTSVLEV